VECTRLPLVAVIVKVFVPFRAVVAGTDITVDPEPEMVTGLKKAVAGTGDEVIVKPTGPLNPFELVIVTV